jgi:hypothetical protein
MRDDAAAKAVEDATPQLDAAQDMRMVADDDIGPCIDRGLAYGRVGPSAEVQHDAPVGDDDRCGGGERRQCRYASLEPRSTFQCALPTRLPSAVLMRR